MKKEELQQLADLLARYCSLAQVQENEIKLHQVRDVIYLVMVDIRLSDWGKK